MSAATSSSSSSSSTTSWKACFDQKYFIKDGYELFLYDLYGVTKGLKPTSTSLLADEMALLKGLEAFDEGNSSLGHDVDEIQALQRTFNLDNWPYPKLGGKAGAGFLLPELKPTPVELGAPFRSGEDKAGTRCQWSYIEIAYRIRMLWSCLYQATVAKVNAKADSQSFLEYFFNLNASGIMARLFPLELRAILLQNQIVVNAAVGKKEEATRPKNRPRTEKEYGYLVTGLDEMLAADSKMFLLIPWKNDVVIGGQDGPIGPLSLEAAFVLTLQSSGIDVEQLVRARRDISPNLYQQTPPLSTAANVICDDKLWIRKCRIRSQQDGYQTSTDITKVHTTILTPDEADDSTTIGFYSALHPFGDFEDKFRSGSFPRIPGFIIHAIDFATGQTQFKFKETDIEAAKFYWYVLTGALKDSRPGKFAALPKGVTVDSKLNTTFLKKDGPAGPAKSPWYTYDKSEKEPSNRSVKAHAHDALWDYQRFTFTFQDGAIPKPENGTGVYLSNIGGHMYLVSENDPNTYPRAVYRASIDKK